MRFESAFLSRGLVAVALALGMLSQSAAFAEEFKIGFVNVPRVMDAAPQAEAARGRIEQEFAPRDRELLQYQRRVRAEEDRLAKNSAIMSASERTSVEEELRRLKRELRRSQEEFHEDLNLRRSQELSKLQRKITEVVQSMAKVEAYDLILTDGVVFAGDRVDITDTVIERLQAEFRGTN